MNDEQRRCAEGILAYSVLNMEVYANECIKYFN